MKEDNNEVLNLYDDSEEVLELEPINESIENTTQNINSMENSEEILEIDPIEEQKENVYKSAIIFAPIG